METIDIIRSAESAPKVLATLSVYMESLRPVAAIPDWLLRLPLKGAEDVSQRMAALTAVVSLSSRHLRHQDTAAARRALQVFAAASWRLRADRGWDDVH